MSQQRLAQKLTRFNNQAGSPRRYQTFTETRDAKGRSVHTYGDGRRVTVTSPAVRSSPAGITKYSTQYAPRMNNVKGNPRQGSQFSTISRGGNTYHRYDAEAGGIPAETYRVKRKK
jgi:hypothetical protein